MSHTESENIPSPPEHPIVLCIQYLIENFQYDPHSEWNHFMKMLQKEAAGNSSTNASACTNKCQNGNSSPTTQNIEKSSNLNGAKTFPSTSHIPAPPRQYMKYKWILICRHLEAFLHEDMDLQIEDLIVEQDDQEGSEKAAPRRHTTTAAHSHHHNQHLIDWTTDFECVLRRIQEAEKHYNSVDGPAQPAAPNCVSNVTPHTMPLRRKSVLHQPAPISIKSVSAGEHSHLKPTVAHSEGTPSNTRKRPAEPFSNAATSPQSAPPPLPSRQNRKSKQIVTREIRSSSVKKPSAPFVSSRQSIIDSDSNNYKQLSKELDMILQHQLNQHSTPADAEETENASKSSAPKSTKSSANKYLTEWEYIAIEAHNYRNIHSPQVLLFYAHDRDILLTLRKCKYDRDQVLGLMRQYFIQESIVDELVDLFSLDDASLFDRELKQLQTIASMPRSAGKSFASLHENHENFLYKYGQVLIREPKLFLRVCHVLHKKSALYWIVEDETTFSYLSQVLTIDEALSLLMNYGHDQTLSKLSVAILKRYSEQHLRLFLLQIVNSLNTCAASVLSTENCVVEFLIQKASEDFDVAQLLNWYLSVSADDPDATIRGMYQSIHYHLLIALKQNGSDFLKLIVGQQKLVKYLTQISSEFKGKKVSRKKKVSLLHRYLDMGPGTNGNDKCPRFDWRSIFGDDQSFCLPLSPSKLVGIDAKHASIFKSAMQPMRIVFRTPSDHEHVSLMWKFGDDLRQDECVILLIELIDTVLFRGEHMLDLRLTPYRCLATSSESGFVQLVPNVTTVYNALQECGSILAYFEKHNPPNQMHTVLDNYTRSLAGNCIISFLLGLGDRHLENILLTIDGRLFHIDFGFIMGYDPKPFAPKLRITDDMLNVFNGVDSPGFDAFMQYCSHAFQILRQHASLLIGLMRMMTNLPHINEASIQKTLVRNLRLDLNNEDAFMFYRKIFTKSLIALAPKITERIHNIAQSFRD